MEHARQLLTRPLSEDQLRAERTFVVQHLWRHVFENCEVLFGYAWGNDYYPGNGWAPEVVELELLERKVADVERSGGITSSFCGEISTGPLMRCQATRTANFPIHHALPVSLSALFNTDQPKGGCKAESSVEADRYTCHFGHTAPGACHLAPLMIRPTPG